MNLMAVAYTFYALRFTDSHALPLLFTQSFVLCFMFYSVLDPPSYVFPVKDKDLTPCFL